MYKEVQVMLSNVKKEKPVVTISGCLKMMWYVKREISYELCTARNM